MKKHKRTNRIKALRNKLKGKLLFSIIFLCIGFLLGFLQDKYLQEFDMFNFKSSDFLEMIFKISQIIVIFILGLLGHIIIHEAGHLIFGLLSGYSFVSFRVGSFIIIKGKKNLELKRYNIPGTAGQCLMMPPELREGKFPFIMYNLGGVLINLIVSIISILMVVYMKGLGSILEGILIISSLSGMIAVLTNGIPMKIGGIANDGYNIFLMMKDDEARKGFYLQLRVNGLQSEGVRIKDMPLSMFKLEEGADLSNPLNTSVRLMEYSWYLDNMDLENAKLSINSLVPYFHKIIPLYRYETNCERIFLELIGDCDKNLIDRLYDENLKKYIKAAKFMLSKKRLLIAYEGYYNEDKNKALEYYEEIKESAKKFPVKGDADTELMIVDWIMKDLSKI